MEDYLIAIRRKLQIAEYHRAELHQAAEAAEGDVDGLPPVNLQAHFEAACRAVVAMLDQLASGIAAELSLGPVHEATPKKVISWLRRLEYPGAEELVVRLETLNDDPRLNDIRDVRNRSTHRFDEKAYHHNAGWLVEPARWIPEHVRPYDGPRAVSEYVNSMVAFAESLAATAEALAASACYLADRYKPAR